MTTTEKEQTMADKGTSTQDGAEKQARMGSYTVFEKVTIDHEPDEVFDAWRVIGTDVKARKDTDAISTAIGALEDEPDGQGEYVAVPRWRPRKAKVETVTRRSWQ